MNSSLRRILVTGATGKQGGATVRALLRANETSPSGPRFEVLAVTRNPESVAAKKLASLSNVKLVKGNLDDAHALFEAAGGDIYGVFSVQVAMGGGANVRSEERQGKALADEADKAGVQHFVYTGVDFGELEGTTGIPQFDSKRRIEEHIKAKKDLKWTILRPVAFMDAFFDPRFPSLFPTLLKTKIHSDVKLQLVDTADIGVFAAKAFANPTEYIGTTLSIAGDELTYGEVAEAWHDVFGRRPKTTFSFLATIVMLMFKELRTLWTFIDKHGYKADISRCREIYPELHTFRQYLERKKVYPAQDYCKKCIT